MAHPAQIEFCTSVRNRFSELFKNNTVLDVGSLDINGNNRYLFTDCEYTGVDLGKGPNVDVVSKGHEFKPGRQYGIVISTECFEHDRYWKETVKNCVELTKQGGLFLFTCATTGRPEHGTSRMHSGTSPFTSKMWGDYYRNLTEQDFKSLPWWKDSFAMSAFITNTKDFDLYFWGIKK